MTVTYNCDNLECICNKPDSTPKLTISHQSNFKFYCTKQPGCNCDKCKQPTLSSLNSSFNLPTSSRKTLKTSVKKSEGLECAVMKAFDFIQRGNSEGYTSIEFKYADCYFVIAKLKEKS